MDRIFRKAAFVSGLVFYAWLCGPKPSAEGAFRVPWQGFDPELECETQGSRGGYFRPEYVELVQRLDTGTMHWLESTYPELGWNNMDRRVYTPKTIPGTGEERSFRYDTARRHMEMEALFHFGPLGGNGTLIADLVELDRDRLLTVNRGSCNLSVIDIKDPDVDGVIPSPRGLEAFELNLPAGEIYLVERNSTGMLVYSLKDYSSTDTLFLDFHPGAVLLSSDTRYLYLTDESTGSLVCIDLDAEGDSPRRVRTGLEPPYILAGETVSGKIILISRSSGELRAFKPRSLASGPSGLSVRGRLLSYCSPPEVNALYLASGGCTGSTVYSLKVKKDDNRLVLERLVRLGSAARRLVSDPEGENLYAIAGNELYLIDTVKREIRKRVGFPSRPRDVLTFGDKVFITGGLSDLYTLKGNLDGGMQRVTLEAGPGPMVAREGRLYVANGLSSSITILKTKNLEEEISILVGVLLGRMVYKDRRIVVNNCFRDNVMVLNPDDFMIEEIVPAGGAMEYSPQGENFVMFDDSMAVSMGRMPSKVALNEITDLPRGVKLFAPTGNPDVFLVLDQDRYICRVNLKQRFRRGMIPLPDECRGLFTFGKRAWVLGTHELYSFPVDETVGLTHTYSARPFKISPPYVATDGFSRDRGSELKLISRDRLGDVFTTRGEIRLLRQDPDTTYTWIGTSREVYIFNNKTSRQRSLVSVTEEVREIYLPPGSIHGYIATRDKTYIVDRETLFRRDEIDVGGDFIYASGDELFLRDPYDPRRMIVADGYRGSLFQELTLPLVPTDAASDGDRLFLLGGAQGAIAVYVNRINTARLPRRLDRRVWDTDADRRSGTHR